MTMDLHNHPCLLLTPPISDQKYSQYDLLIVLANNYYRSLSTHLCFGGSLILTAPLICMGHTTYGDDVAITIILILMSIIHMFFCNIHYFHKFVNSCDITKI